VSLAQSSCGGEYNYACPILDDIDLAMDGIYTFRLFDSDADNAGSFQFSINCILGSCPGFEAAAVDSFDLYVTQEDTTPQTIGEEEVYAVQSGGAANEGVVASLSGPDAVGTAFKRRGADVIWELRSQANPAATEGDLVMKATIPGATSGSGAGSFASLFQNTQSLSDQSLAVAFEALDPGEQCKLSASLVMVDVAGNRSASPPVEIDRDAALVQLPFVDFLNPLSGPVADIGNVDHIEIEFYAQANGAPAAHCLVDDVEIKLFDFPTNDDGLTGAAPLTRGKRVIGTLTKATIDGPGPNPDVWYQIEAPADGVVEADTCGTGEYGIDTLLALHTAAPGTGGNQIVINDNWTTAGSLSARTTERCLARGTSADAAVRATVAAGQMVWVRVSRPVGPDTGPFLLAAPEADAAVGGFAGVCCLAMLGWTRRTGRVGR
jgi:hypothetical protein